MIFLGGEIEGSNQNYQGRVPGCAKYCPLSYSKPGKLQKVMKNCCKNLDYELFEFLKGLKFFLQCTTLFNCYTCKDVSIL